MPDMLRMKEMVEKLEKTSEILNEMSKKLSTSMEEMVNALKDTQRSIQGMEHAVGDMTDRTATSIEGMSQKFDILVATLVELSKGFKNPLDPKNIVTTARDLLKPGAILDTAKDLL
nr:hypothetical protein [Candidatus Sigynarchaeota archaeon]